MRARQLKPGIFKNEKLGSADPLLTILFEGLWCMADREGRMEDRPLRICAEVFPYRRGISEKKVAKMLDWLEHEGFLVRYEADGGICEKTTVAKRIRAIQVLNFSRHQNPHTEEKHSIIPPLKPISHRANTVEAPDEPGKSPEVVGLTPDSGLLTPDSVLRTRKRARETGSAGEGTGSREPSPAYELTERIKAIYPAGTYRASNWILAERAIGKLLDDGEDPEQLLALARAFAAQQLAKGSVGTQFVLSPEKFFGPDGHWRGPFPLPQASGPKPRRLKSATEIAEEGEARDLAAAGGST